MVSVIIELDPHTVRTRSGEQIDLRDQSTISRLVDRGLRARLKLQSLLTSKLSGRSGTKQGRFCCPKGEARIR